MKNWKQFTVMAIIAIIVFAACDDGNNTTHTHDWGNWVETIPPTITEDGLETRTCKSDPSHQETRPIDALAKPFFGRWENNDNPLVLIINANSYKMKVADEDNIFITLFGIDNPVWTNAINEEEASKDEYPSGYNLDGFFSSDSSGANFPEADVWPYSVDLFINATKNKLCLQIGGSVFFTKQEN